MVQRQNFIDVQAHERVRHSTDEPVRRQTDIQWTNKQVDKLQETSRRPIFKNKTGMSLKRNAQVDNEALNTQTGE